MLRQNCSYKNDIETRKKQKSKEKIQVKFAMKMLTYDDYSKKCDVTFKKFCIFESF